MKFPLKVVPHISRARGNGTAYVGARVEDTDGKLLYFCYAVEKAHIGQQLAQAAKWAENAVEAEEDVTKMGIEGCKIRQSSTLREQTIGELLQDLHDSYTAMANVALIVCRCNGCRANRNGIRNEIERRCV